MGPRGCAMRQTKGNDQNFPKNFDLGDFDHFPPSYGPKRARYGIFGGSGRGWVENRDFGQMTDFPNFQRFIPSHPPTTAKFRPAGKLLQGMLPNVTE